MCGAGRRMVKQVDRRDDDDALFALYPPPRSAIVFILFLAVVVWASDELPGCGRPKTVCANSSSIREAEFFYEDPSPIYGGKVARSFNAVVCPHLLLRERLACGRLNFSSPLQGHVYYDCASKLYSYEPDACTLRRLRAPEAKACMADVGPIVFIGDSVTRYQFLALVHFLAAGRYQHPFDGPKSLTNVYQHEGHGKSKHYDVLWEQAVGQVRYHAAPDGYLYVNHDRDEKLEHAHLQLLDSRSGRPVDVYYHYISFAHRSSVQRAITWALTKHTNISTIILAACAHYSQANKIPPDVHASLAWAKERLSPGTRLVWKSCATPYPKKAVYIDRAEAAIRAGCTAKGVDVYDVRPVARAAAKQRLVSTWTADTVHFWQWVYRDFNDVLLNILCPPPPVSAIVSILLLAVVVSASKGLPGCGRPKTVCAHSSTRKSSRWSSQFENPRPRHGSKVAHSSKAVVCPHSLLRERPACGLLNFSSPLQGHVYYDCASKLYSYEPDACVLRRLRARDAKACLADVGPIVFIGDSVTRYQFLALVHFLAAGKYQHPFDGPKSLTNVYQHDSKKGQSTFDVLWREAQAQVRHHAAPDGDLYVNHHRDQGMEHAHLKLKDGRSGRPVDVYYHYSSYASRSSVQHAVKWALSSHHNVSTIIFAACAHYSQAYKIPPDVRASLAWAKKAVRPGTRLVWKSCSTPSNKKAPSIDKAEKALRHDCAAAGAEVYDVRAVARAAAKQRLVSTWTADTVHFWQWVYRDFNDVLLNILCPPKPARIRPPPSPRNATV
ncbi:hypothetical protein TSOC_012231 [Tetrabaena socialis]|uniref:Uncharacterized protein n=1 Tax=Tetrabaena socialis TaxID=47790 RepID=A0A2J7ZNK7_9CHLO|nr:hypothetical protein TSOC_012231 [Tetrabaena socialis]|eukprot:PNH01853.1 hypothetical protein TSOC_012231 [Tetrabaena socialis]